MGQEVVAVKGEVSQSEMDVALRVGSVDQFFAKYDEVQSNGGPSVEKFVDCPENKVLLGWGGRVDGDGNFTDIKIACGLVHLYYGLIKSYHPSATTSAEKFVEADPDNVVVGVGGVVNGNNLARAVIKQCPWDKRSMTVNPALCTYKSSDGSTTTERFMDIHNLVDPARRPWTVLTGMGATAGSEVL